MNKMRNTTYGNSIYNNNIEKRQERRSAMMNEYNKTGSISGVRTPVKQAVMNALDGGEMESIIRPYHCYYDKCH